MEPITTFILISAAAGMTTGTYVFFLNAYGKRLINTGVDSIKRKYQNIFIKRNIAFFGDKGSGKTSLIYFLENGVPLTKNNGKFQTAEPTFGVVVIGAAVKTYSQARKEQMVKILSDVSGDKPFRYLWKEILKDTEPSGIVYMLDGRISNEKISKAISPIFEDVLSYYLPGSASSSKRNLKAFHIFISFSDCWATSQSAVALKETFVTMAFHKEFGQPDYAHLQDLNIAISTVNLAPNGSSWPQVDRALNRFGADLNDS